MSWHPIWLHPVVLKEGCTLDPVNSHTTGWENLWKLPWGIQGCFLWTLFSHTLFCLLEPLLQKENSSAVLTIGMEGKGPPWGGSGSASSIFGLSLLVQRRVSRWTPEVGSSLRIYFLTLPFIMCCQIMCAFSAYSLHHIWGSSPNTLAQIALIV